jgi:hypothetical protein
MVCNRAHKSPPVAIFNPDPNVWNPHSVIFIWILTSRQCLGAPSGLVASGFSTIFIHMRSTWPIHFIYLTNLVRGTLFGVPHYADFSTRLSLVPSYVQMSKTHSVYFLPFIWESRYLNHTKLQEKLYFGYLHVYCFRCQRKKNCELDIRKDSSNLIWSSFLHACNFDSLVSL